MFQKTTFEPRYGVDGREYHGMANAPRGSRDRVMSRSDLVRFAECPHKWLHAPPPTDKSDEMNWGSLVDCLFLTPQHFDATYAVAPKTFTHVPGRRTKDNPDKQPEERLWDWRYDHCAEWAEEVRQSGRIPIKDGEYLAAVDAVQAMQCDPQVFDFMRDSKASVWIQAEWQDDKTGIVVPFKILIDIVTANEGPLGDLKTTSNADPSAWASTCSKFKYHYQAALYLDVYNAVTGEKRDTFAHIVSESVPPYEVGRRYFSEEFIAEGRRQYRKDLARYCECLAKNEWPGYEPGFTLIEPKPWMIEQV